jgi:hypothetical protein
VRRISGIILIISEQISQSKEVPEHDYCNEDDGKKEKRLDSGIQQYL